MRFSDLKLNLISWFRLRTFGKSIKILLDLLQPAKEDVILDVGAGTGVIASRVSTMCDEVFALEPRMDRVAFIKRKFPEVKAFDGVAENIQFPESYFTKVYTVSAFHHFNNQDQAVSEFARILKPGGFLLIHEIYPTSGLAKVETRVSKMKFLTHESLEEKLKLSGFQMKKLEGTKQGYFLLSQKT